MAGMFMNHVPVQADGLGLGGLHYLSVMYALLCFTDEITLEVGNFESSTRTNLERSTVVRTL